MVNILSMNDLIPPTYWISLYKYPFPIRSFFISLFSPLPIATDILILSGVSPLRFLYKPFSSIILWISDISRPFGWSDKTSQITSKRLTTLESFEEGFSSISISNWSENGKIFLNFVNTSGFLTSFIASNFRYEEFGLYFSRSFIDKSSFSRLHVLHDETKLSHELVPPLLFGIRWSNSISEPLLNSLPQYTHLNLSLIATTSLRDNAIVFGKNSVSKTSSKSFFNKSLSSFGNFEEWNHVWKPLICGLFLNFPL